MDAGVNRLSIGVQSFDDAAARRIGRVHDGARRRGRRCERARWQRLRRINLDLMYALPGQNRAGAPEDVDAALAAWGRRTCRSTSSRWSPTRVFPRSPPELPDDDTA